ncbi:MAG: YIP1 family protein [Chloroflexaceae bacterium]|nr:YIP1 family protein [Chloroflexaceae bacterium]
MARLPSRSAVDFFTTIFRLALGGLLLDTRVYRAQRESPTGVQRALLVVVLVGLLTGLAVWIGDIGEYLTQPDPQALRDTLYNGLTAMPWYDQVAQANPEFVVVFEQIFADPSNFTLTANPLVGALGIVVTPLVGIVGWFLGGSIVHIAARAFGGAASYAQTLACTGLASGVNLLGVVQIVPYAEAFPAGLWLATTLLGLLATYVAVREAHGLAPWRSFWAVLIGPLLLIAVLVALYCCVVFVFAGAVGSLVGGAGR